MLPGFGRLGLPVFGAFRVRVLTLQGLGGLGFRQVTILGFRVFRIKLRPLGWLRMVTVQGFGLQTSWSPCKCSPRPSTPSPSPHLEPATHSRSLLLGFRVLGLRFRV